MESSKISAKGQITLPLAVRKAMNLNEGDIVAFEKIDGAYLLKSIDAIAIKKIKEQMGDLATDLQLNTLEDVADFILELDSSLTQAKNGNVVDSETMFKELRNKYAN